MKRLLFTLLFFPIAASAQNSLPRFEHDTLYTSCGYKIYEGQVLHLGNGTSEAGYFKFIKFHPSLGKNNTYTLQNSTLLVKKLKAYKYPGAENSSIRIAGTLTYKDGTTEQTDLLLNFERATTDYDNQPSELVIPASFKTRRAEQKPVEVKKQPVITETKEQPAPGDIKNLLVADEIKKLFDLYKQGALTKEEYETQKKKLLDRQ